MSSHTDATTPHVKVDLNRPAPAGTHWNMIDELREQHRFFWADEAQGYWVLTRYEDIREAFQTPDVFCNHSIVATNPDPEYRFLPSFSDPPIHMAYRRPMNPWFSPGAVAKLEPRLRELARAEVEAVLAAGRCDYMSTFADRFPVAGFLASMGLPMDDADFFVSVAHRMSGAVGSEPEAVAQMNEAWGELAAYWTEMLADRRATPLDPEVDFLTMLSQSMLVDEPMPDADIVDIMVTLTLGSLDTLKSQLGWQLWHLGTHPEDLARIVADPSLVPGAVEEFLRAFPIVSMARKVTHDVDFHGCPMKKDEMVLLTIQAATRDPRVFPNPEQVIIDRSPNRHIAFGASEHRCLGSHLARTELQLAIEEWVRLIPDFRVDTEEPLLAKGGQVSLLELPLAWPAAGAT
ncbi:MAG: cytochrome P450 [Ilumatobacteraceae bacterium]